MNKIWRITLITAPLLIFLSLLFFLWRGLFIQPEILPSALIGEPVPAFRLSNLMAPAYPLTEQSLKGKVSLLNVWASWCSACEMEHSMLMEIKTKYQIPIYGIDYKDDPKISKLFLREMGNPFSAIGNDSTGEVAMDFGVYGTPETFVVDRKGFIVYRHVGVIDEQVWQKELLPLIESLK